MEMMALCIVPEQMNALLKRGNYYPGWDMNKKNWYTMIPDEGIGGGELCLSVYAPVMLSP